MPERMPAPPVSALLPAIDVQEGAAVRLRAGERPMTDYDYEGGLQDRCVNDPLWAADEIERLRNALLDLVRATWLVGSDAMNDPGFRTAITGFVLDRRAAACGVVGIGPVDPVGTVRFI